MLPEDRFIKDDLISQHYIKQKEDGQREKLKQAEKQREENKNDPNIVPEVGYDDEDDKPNLSSCKTKWTKSPKGMLCKALS